MRPVKMELRNFGSYIGKHSLELEPGLTFFTGVNLDDPDKYDNNASGKTTLFNAFSWIHYGETPSGLRTRDLINHYSTDCSGTVWYDDGLVVERSYVKKEALKITIDGEDLQGDERAIQKRLVEHLNLSPSLFFSCYYLGRNAKSVQFLHATPAPRAKLLAELIDDEVFQVASRLADKQLDVTLGKINDGNYRSRELNNRISQLIAEIDQLTESLKRADVAEVERKERIQERLDKLRYSHRQCEKKIMQKPARDMKAIETERQALVLKQKDLAEQMRDLGIVPVDHLEPGTCMTCLQPITKASIKAANEKMDELKKQYKNYKEQYEIIAALVAKLAEAQRELRDFEAERTKAKENAEYYRVEIAHLEDELASPPVGRSELSSALLRAKEQKRDTEQLYDECVSATAKLLTKADDLKFLKKAFASEIRSLLFDRLRTMLDHYTQAYLHHIVGDHVDIEYPKSNNLKDHFKITVKTGVKEQDLSAYSEGESWRLSFAVLLALRSTMLQLAQSKLNLLLIDDPIGGLDNTGIQHFLDTLRKLVDEDKLVDQLFVTIPRDDVLRGDRVVTVKKWKKASKIL